MAVEDVAGARRHEEDVGVRDPAAPGHEADELGIERLRQSPRHAVCQREQVRRLFSGQLVPEGDVPLGNDQGGPARRGGCPG